MFFKKKSFSQQLETGLLAPAEQIVPGLLGWTYQHLPVFLFEQLNNDEKPSWKIHFSHRCGFNGMENSNWLASRLDAPFTFIGGNEVQFCPRCVAIVDQLFAPNLAELGLENNYDPAFYFSNLAVSFPYLFWNTVESSTRAKISGYLPLTPDSLSINHCENCESINTQVIQHADEHLCIRCASAKQLNDRAIDDQSTTQAFIEHYQQRKREPKTWSEVQHYLPAVWGRLIRIFEGHQLPIPILWQPATSVCEQHHDTLPLVWPELGKAVLMHPAEASIEWQDDLERWDFFTVLAEM